jgi:ATP-dependent protease ClpP protease subunit
MNNNNEVLNIEILDDIGGWGFTFAELYNQAKGFTGSKIRVPVNSFGGQVFEALLIYNYLKGSGKEIETHIPTYAMSAGTVIASAGEKVTMSTNGYYMIHNPYTVSFGDAEDMKSAANLLDKMTNDLISIYVAKTGLEADEIREMMNNETWLTSEEALEKGFVDELTEGAKIEANFDPKQFETFSNVPEDIQNLFETPTATETEKPPTNSFLSALAQIFNKQPQVDLSEYVSKSEHEAIIEEMKKDYDTNEATWRAEHTKEIEAKEKDIEEAKAIIQALKKTPIEEESTFETSPASSGNHNKFFTSFDLKVIAANKRKKR